MIGIIFIHSIFYPFSPGQELYPTDYLRILLSDAFKYGTLCFFLISGYLLGVKLDQYSGIEFFSKRLRTVAKPWFFWSALLTTTSIISPIIKNKSWELIEILSNVYLKSEYWFVLNYFIALAVMLLFRNTRSNIAGIIFLLCSLFYSTNIYLKIIPTIHTTAIFGYMFFLWYGQELRRGNNRFIIATMQLKNSTLIIIAIISYSLSVTESIVIKKYLGIETSSGIYFNDPINTLRITNQIYGLVVFLLIFNIKKTIFPLWLRPRDETFGLYLVHWPILIVLTKIFSIVMAVYLDKNRENLIQNSHINFDWISMLAIVLVFFLILYLSSLIFVKTIRRTRFSWVVGKV